MTLEWAPLIPLPMLALLALVIIATGLATLLGRKGSALLRLLAGTLLILALANPSIVREEREKLKDVAVLLIDRSGSQSLSVRETQTNLALAEVKKNLATLPNLDVRIVETTPAGENGTRLFAALESALSDVPPERIAGAILVTDGIIHDIPNTLNALGFRAPLHTLITGLPAERDRRIELLDAPPLRNCREATNRPPARHRQHRQRTRFGEIAARWQTRRGRPRATRPDALAPGPDHP